MGLSSLIRRKRKKIIKKTSLKNLKEQNELKLNDKNTTEISLGETCRNNPNKRLKKVTFSNTANNNPHITKILSHCQQDNSQKLTKKKGNNNYLLQTFEFLNNKNIETDVCDKDSENGFDEEADLDDDISNLIDGNKRDRNRQVAFDNITYGGLINEIGNIDDDSNNKNDGVKSNDYNLPSGIPLVDESRYNLHSFSDFIEADEANINTISNPLDFSSILKPLNNASNLDNSLLEETRNHLSQLQKDGSSLKLFSDLSLSKKTLIDRSFKYEKVKNDMRKWMPQIKLISDADSLRFGPESQESQFLNAEKLNGIFDVNTDFEKELNDAILESNLVDVNMAMSKDYKSKKNTIIASKDQSMRDKIGRLKSLLRREQERSKKLNKIKSKMWHRKQQKIEANQREKILSRIDAENPELANKLREQYEVKRAEIRFLLRRNAIKKWSKTALRYGGKDLSKVVTREFQKEHDERSMLENVAKGSSKSKFYGSDSETDDRDNSMVDGEGCDKSDKMNTKLKLSILQDLKENDEPLPQEGIFNLKFMRLGIEKRRQESKKIIDEILDDNISLDGSIDTGENLKVFDNSIENDIKLEINNASKNKTLPRFSKLELSNARSELIKRNLADSCLSKSDCLSNLVEDKSLSNNNSSTTKIASNNAILGNVKSSYVGHHSDTNDSGDKYDSVNEPMEENAGNFHQNDPMNDDNHEIKKDVLEATVDEEAKILELYNLFEEKDTLKSAQRSVIQQAFSTKYEKDFILEGDDDENDELLNSEIQPNASLVGWGGWTGFGVKSHKTCREKRIKSQETNIKSSLSEVKADQNKKSDIPIIINQKLDRKMAKYYVDDVPKSFGSRVQYELSLCNPTGLEWNTFSDFKEQVRPKINVTLGAVIPPLQYIKHLPTEQIDTVLEAYQNKRKNEKSRPLSKL